MQLHAPADLERMGIDEQETRGREAGPRGQHEVRAVAGQSASLAAERDERDPVGALEIRHALDPAGADDNRLEHGRAPVRESGVAERPSGGDDPVPEVQPGRRPTTGGMGYCGPGTEHRQQHQRASHLPALRSRCRERSYRRTSNVRVSIVASVLPRRRSSREPPRRRIRTCERSLSFAPIGTSMQNASRAVVCSACTNGPPLGRE